jgi:hypothetical protein
MVLAVPVWATNVVPGQYDTSAMFNTFGNNGTFLTNPPIFAAYQSAAQSIPNTTITAVGMDTTLIDSYNGHSNVTNNSRYTPTVSGWYLFIGSVSYVQNATGNRLAEFHKNGSGSAVNLGQGAQPTCDTNNLSTVRALAVVQMNGTSDYVELDAYQTSGGALNTGPSQTGFFAFWMHA